MGYYTRFAISVTPASASDEVMTRIGEVSRYWVGPRPNDNEIKWYAHEKHITSVSREFPDVLITVDGCGEGHDEDDHDRWRKYFRAGRMAFFKMLEWCPPPLDWCPPPPPEDMVPR